MEETTADVKIFTKYEYKQRNKMSNTVTLIKEEGLVITFNSTINRVTGSFFMPSLCGNQVIKGSIAQCKVS